MLVTEIYQLKSKILGIWGIWISKKMAQIFQEVLSYLQNH